MITLLYTNKNVASKNIAEELEDYLKEEKNCKLIDMNTDSIVYFDPYEFVEKEWKKGDYIIVLSSHKSSSNVPALTIHPPGNWGKADFGGKDNYLSFSYATKMLIGLLEMSKRADIEVTYEADHHGPSIDYPIMYIELGNPYWNNKKYAKIIAEAVLRIIDNKEDVEANLAFGGNHYMTKFTKLSKEKGYAFSHFLPKHHSDNIENMFEQALTKSVEKVEKVFLDKKGLRKEGRDSVKKKANEFGLELEIV